MNTAYHAPISLSERKAQHDNRVSKSEQEDRMPSVGAPSALHVVLLALAVPLSVVAVFTLAWLAVAVGRWGLL
jgi:hypothetical protein